MHPKFIRKSDVLASAEGDVRLEEVCLYEQPFIKDNSITVSQLIIGYEMKLKEEIQVRRFARFKLGDPEFTVATGEANSLSG
jgi:elongation factor Ts